MDRLPEELIQEIIRSLTGDYSKADSSLYSCTSESFLKVNIDLKLEDDDQSIVLSGHPLYHLSILNRRIREISLPFLFRQVDFVLHDDGEAKVARFEQILKRNAHLTHLIRHARLIHASSDSEADEEYTEYERTDYDPAMHTPLLVLMLQRLTGLERLDIPWATISDWVSHLPVLQAANRHIALKSLMYAQAEGHLGDLQVLGEQSPFLSRIVVARYVVSDYLVAPAPSSYIAMLIEQGLRTEELVSPTGDWYRTTYQGLIGVHDWTGEISSEDFHDFLSRHSLLRFITLRWSLGQEITPWGKRLRDDMAPHRCSIDSSSHTFAVRGAGAHATWKMRNAHVTLTVITSAKISQMIAQLGKALPDVRDLKLSINIENESTLELDVDSDSLVKLLASNFDSVGALELPEIMFETLLDGWSPSDGDPSRLLYPLFSVAPSLEYFTIALARAIPSLSQLSISVPVNTVGNRWGVSARKLMGQIARNGDEVAAKVVSDLDVISIDL